MDIQRNRMDKKLQPRERQMNVPRILAFLPPRTGPFVYQLYTRWELLGSPGRSVLRPICHLNLGPHFKGRRGDVLRTFLTARCDVCHNETVTWSRNITGKQLFLKGLSSLKVGAKDRLQLSW